MATLESAIPEILKGADVLVVGFGLSGQAAAELLLSEGARVQAVDDDVRLAETVDPAGWEARGVRVRLGEVRRREMERLDLMVISPGVPLSSSWVDWAREAGVPVVGEIEVASWAARAPIAVVGGTNGKSTTTELLGAAIREWGRPVEVGGNIGRALSAVVRGVPPEGWIVAEVSSFQMETIHRFRPRVAIYLNLTPDHLDRYASVNEYGAAKERMFENQTESDLAVLNRDDAHVWSTRERIRARVLATSLSGRVDEGVSVEAGRVVARIGGRSFDVCARDDILIRGPRNLSNALAVVAAALWMGAPASAVARALATFEGLPHRMESLGTAAGIEFVNDSKATNVEAVLSALSSFTRPVILIAGGLGKGLDFSPLAGASRGVVRRAILIGASREEIGRVLEPVADVEFAETLSGAVRRAYETANSGETVLLSPACASFDMFRNFEHRGDAFRAEVRTLMEGIG